MLKSRPVGVTVIGILFVITGAISILGGIAAIVAAPFLSQINSNSLQQQQQLQSNGVNTPFTPSQQLMFIQGAAQILPIVGGILVAVGVASIVVAYGLFKGKTWAWTVSVILSIIAIVINVASLAAGNISAIVGIVINGAILYYLYRRNVKAYFGKIPATPPSKM